VSEGLDSVGQKGDPTADCRQESTVELNENANVLAFTTTEWAINQCPGVLWGFLKRCRDEADSV
jgi:hypothetical protein